MGKTFTSEIFECGALPCSNKFYVRIIDQEKIENTSGWWILRCTKCLTIFHKQINKGAFESQLLSGGAILERFTSSVEEERVIEKIKKYTETF